MMRPGNSEQMRKVLAADFPYDNRRAGTDDKLRALQRDEDFRARRGVRPDDVAQARALQGLARGKGHRPPFWNSKLYGQPFGEFNRNRPRAPAAVGGPRAKAPAAPAAPAAAPRPAPKAPYEDDTRDVAELLAPLEERMRRAVLKKTRLHERPEDVLHAAFARATGQPRVTERSRATVDEFRGAWEALGVRVERRLAHAAFNRYGQDAQGRVPVFVFSKALLSGAARRLARQDDVLAYPCDPGHLLAHRGAIRYPECKKPVYAPSGLDAAAIARSQQPPDVRLRLEFVHGYEGKSNTCPNVFYTKAGEVMYYVAGVVVVYNKEKHTQRFFTGHDDDVSCLAVSRDRSLAASGQVTGAGRDGTRRPCRVLVWDTETLGVRAELVPPEGHRSALCAAFSPSGRRVAAAFSDNQHTLFVWDVASRAVLASVKTVNGTPPATYGVQWSPFEDRLLAYGVNYIKFFSFSRRGAGGEKGGMTLGLPIAGQFGGVKIHTVTSAVFLPPGDGKRHGVVLTGTPDGYICQWEHASASAVKCTGRLSAHGIGPEVHRPDGSLARHGVRALVLRRDNRTLLSAGADGVVRFWDVSAGTITGKAVSALPLLPAAAPGASPPAIRALDCLPGSDVFVAGTSSCEIWEVDRDPEPLIVGHQSDIYALAMHPTRPGTYVTGSEAGRAMFWSAETRRVTAVVDVGGKIRSLAFSPSGALLAVGMRGGGVKVLNVTDPRAPTQAAWLRTFTEGGHVDEVKFSPDGTLLAAGSHDQLVDVFAVTDGFKRVARCHGPSSTVTHLDWSEDGATLMTNDQAYELLYFDARTGRQRTENQRDTRWATYTGVLGFPVMGIWPDDSDGTDINALDRSPSGRYVVTADDFGKVKLKNFPCLAKDAPGQECPGHSSHVMNVRWAADESTVVSVGGKDKGVFQWAVFAPVRGRKYEVAPPFELDEGAPRRGGGPGGAGRGGGRHRYDDGGRAARQGEREEAGLRRVEAERPRRVGEGAPGERGAQRPRVDAWLEEAPHHGKSEQELERRREEEERRRRRAEEERRRGRGEEAARMGQVVRGGGALGVLGAPGAGGDSVGLGSSAAPAARPASARGGNSNRRNESAGVSALFGGSDEVPGGALPPGYAPVRPVVKRSTRPW